MGERVRYVIYDYDRDRDLDEFEAVTVAVAISQFSTFYNAMVRDWATRKLGRYFLVRRAVLRNGRWSVVEDAEIMVAADDVVRLSYVAFREADPPFDAASEAELDREYRRLTVLDAQRLAKQANQALGS